MHHPLHLPPSDLPGEPPDIWDTIVIVSQDAPKDMATLEKWFGAGQVPGGKNRDGRNGDIDADEDQGCAAL